MPHDRVDNRRLEVVVDGLSLHGGAQLAIDTTLVSPLPRDGSVKRGAERTDGAVLVEARRWKERTYPELAGVGGRAKLVVLPGISTILALFGIRQSPLCTVPAFTGGVACWGAPRPNPSPYRCWMVQRPELVVPLRLCMMCSVSAGMRLVSRCS